MKAAQRAGTQASLSAAVSPDGKTREPLAPRGPLGDYGAASQRPNRPQVVWRPLIHYQRHDGSAQLSAQNRILDHSQDTRTAPRIAVVAVIQTAASNASRIQ
jgi:hypothetical protein